MAYYRNKNISAIFETKEKGNMALSLAVILGLLMISVLYLTQINGVVERNFELRAAQASLKETQNNNQQLMISLMRVRSLSNLENAARNLNLVTIEGVGYLKAVSGFFALSQKP